MLKKVFNPRVNNVNFNIMYEDLVVKVLKTWSNVITLN